MIIAVVFFEFYVFGTSTKQKTTESYFTAYYNEFKNTPTSSYNYTFSPPVSMYHALLIALESGGWNATSLKNMTISIGLDYCAFFENLSSQSGWETLGNCTFRTNPPVTGFLMLHPVTQAAVDWSPQQISGITYRYVWTIAVEGPGNMRSIPPLGLYYVDAATAELVPTGNLY